MFGQRRKTLSNALGPFALEMGVYGGRSARGRRDRPARRPETLEIVEIARLADVFATGKR
jgi:16S rRNA A1518/A1519 N6-dimethyltransferase RsmA/KsgA/DIM1 with predicted DNA glycosylase/AP lyase activity